MSAREPRVGDTVEWDAWRGQMCRGLVVRIGFGEVRVRTAAGAEEWIPRYCIRVVIDPPEDSGAGDGGL